MNVCSRWHLGTGGSYLRERATTNSIILFHELRTQTCHTSVIYPSHQIWLWQEHSFSPTPQKQLLRDVESVALWRYQREEQRSEGEGLLQSQAGSGRKRLQSSSVRCQHPPHHSLPAGCAQHRTRWQLLSASLSLLSQMSIPQTPIYSQFLGPNPWNSTVRVSLRV